MKSVATYMYVVCVFGFKIQLKSTLQTLQSIRISSSEQWSFQKIWQL